MYLASIFHVNDSALLTGHFAGEENSLEDSFSTGSLCIFSIRQFLSWKLEPKGGTDEFGAS